MHFTFSLRACEWQTGEENGNVIPRCREPKIPLRRWCSAGARIESLNGSLSRGLEFTPNVRRRPHL